jgi:hypothetical protein
LPLFMAAWALGGCSRASAASLVAADAGVDGSFDLNECQGMQGDFCWRDAVDAAAGCLPSPTEQGSLSADGLTCTFASGKTVRFAAEPSRSGGLPSFTIETDGATCASYQAFLQGFVLTTSIGMIAVASGAQGYQLTCPDGTLYTASFGLSFECDGSVPELSVTRSYGGDSAVTTVVQAAVVFDDAGDAALEGDADDASAEADTGDAGEVEAAAAPAVSEVWGSLAGGWLPQPLLLFDCVVP